jgi:GDP-L-fucose synthase
MSKNRIIITGGSGLVGNDIRRIAPQYKLHGFELIFVSSSDYDLTSMTDTQNMFKHHSPTHVIHLAACVGGLFKNMNHKVKMLEDNLQINFNVVKCCHDFKVTKLIACLSTCIFPDKTKYPINETMLHDGPPHSSNDAYAYAKRMLHIQCKAYRDNYGDNFVCVIPTNVYGPNDNFNLVDGHVIPSLIHNCYLAKQKGEHFVVKGTGTPLRQFIYSDDLADLILWTLFHFDDEILILSVPEKDEVSIAEVSRIIADCFDYNDYILFDETYSDGQYKKTADNRRLVEKIGAYKFTDIKGGILTTVRWFNQNYHSSRK